MYSAIDVARYFLAQSDPDAGDTMSNLKLQKLLYYAQGVTLALTEKPLFSDPLEAWLQGPVVPSVFRKYKEAGSGAVILEEAQSEEGDGIEEFDESTREILDEVYQVYGQFSAWKLRSMTQEEPPWRNTPQGSEISHHRLSDFFSTRVILNGQE